jgi:hypothetical protein
MKIYYSDARSNKIVSARKPDEAGAAQAKQILSRLMSAPSYLGILIDDKIAFQAYLNKDGSVWIEKLNRETKSIQGAHVNLKIALEAVDAIYEGKDFMEALAAHYLNWTALRECE